MDIAALSTVMSTAKLQQQASLSVMKMAMNQANTSSKMMNKLMDTNTKMMEQSVSPHLGSNINIKL